MSFEIKDPSVTEYDRLNLLWGDDRGWTPETVQTADFIEQATGFKPCYVSAPVQTIVTVPDDGCGIKKAAVFVQAAHKAFDLHIPFGIRPEVIWTTIPVFRAKLRSMIPETLTDELLPSFSTDTPETRTAMLVTFMDVASDFFKYRGGTLCGIPAFKLFGTLEDWNAIHEATLALPTKFPKLQKWVDSLSKVTSKLKAAANGEQDLKFWRSFFKISGGSGGPHITGWINTFYMHAPQPGDTGGASRTSYNLRRFFDPNRTEHYCIVEDPGHIRYGINEYTLGITLGISQVDFIIDETVEIPERKMKLISGVLGSEFEGRYLTPRLGWSVSPILG